jgi:hypothetical protein
VAVLVVGLLGPLAGLAMGLAEEQAVRALRRERLAELVLVGVGQELQLVLERQLQLAQVGPGRVQRLVLDQRLQVEVGQVLHSAHLQQVEPGQEERLALNQRQRLRAGLDGAGGVRH